MILPDWFKLIKASALIAVDYLLLQVSVLVSNLLKTKSWILTGSQIWFNGSEVPESSEELIDRLSNTIHMSRIKISFFKTTTIKIYLSVSSCVRYGLKSNNYIAIIQLHIYSVVNECLKSFPSNWFTIKRQQVLHKRTIIL